MLSLLRLLAPLLVLAGALLLSVWREARAQTLSLPSQAEMARAGAEIGAQLPIPPDRSLAVPQAGAGAAKAPGPLDLSDLASNYEAMLKGRAAASAGKDGADRQLGGLVIFASLGLPPASLEKLVADAARTRALIVLRGMTDGSMQKTKARIKEATGNLRVSWQIDPTLFERFKVTGVPSFVLIDPTRPVNVACSAADGLCQEASFSKVTGDVPIQFALSDIARRDTKFAALAQRYAAALGGLR